eukprot:6188921-Pleurochrysis_carterae.AAC.4
MQAVPLEAVSVLPSHVNQYPALWDMGKARHSESFLDMLPAPPAPRRQAVEGASSQTGDQSSLRQTIQSMKGNATW